MENATAWYLSILLSRFDISSIASKTGLPVMRIRTLFLSRVDVSDWHEFSAIMQVYLRNINEFKSSVEHYAR